MAVKKIKTSVESGKRDFLLEIGAEEIPSGFIEPALSQLRQKTEELLKQERLAFSKIDTMATPRRLVLFIKDLAQRQEQASETKWGPPKSAAFDKEGKPTRVYDGFKKSQGAEDSQIRVLEREGKGEYLCLKKELPAQPTRQVLPEVLPGLITSIHFAKTMKWDGTLSFARPLRWLLAVYGKDIIKFKLGNLVSGNVTYGHRILSPGPFKVKETDDYFSAIKKAGIILDQRERRTCIEKQLYQQADKIGALKDFNKDLLDEVNYLAESPVLIYGNFKDEYLELPTEVLTTTMGKHQKLFSFFSKKGLLPEFAAVLNGKLKSTVQVRKNYESILEAKLKDSRFFYQEDTKTVLKEKVEDLKKVVFQKKLGSLFDKTQRMIDLAGALAEKIDLDEKDAESLKQAVYLSKADLVTQMVVEFPGLQGIMGREYARSGGEPEEVAVAIGEHYLPRSVTGDLPGSLLGALVSIVDRIDNIAGCFYLGQEPSGSYDPYALKRQASGIVRIILDQKLCLSLNWFVEKALKLYFSHTADSGSGRTGVGEENEVKKKVLAFFRERIYNLLTEAGYKYDLINAVLACSYDNSLDVWRKTEQLNDILDKDEFEKARTVVERTNNILKGAADIDLSAAVQEDRFTDPLEKELWQVYKDSSGKIRQLIAEGSYKEATLTYGSEFYDVIHSFFDQVMVNADDQALRINRLSMMKCINHLYTTEVADLSKIVVTQG